MAINTFLGKKQFSIIVSLPPVQFGTGQLPVAARFITVEVSSHY